MYICSVPVYCCFCFHCTYLYPCNSIARRPCFYSIHALLHTHNVAKSWLDSGIEYITFFQDTNGLAFHTLALSLGVSSSLGLIMNSIACPRKAGQAIGAITKLTKGDETRLVKLKQYQSLCHVLGTNSADL